MSVETVPNWPEMKWKKAKSCLRKIVRELMGEGMDEKTIEEKLHTTYEYPDSAITINISGGKFTGGMVSSVANDQTHGNQMNF